MKLIIGLGNPGKQYEKTRHNVGFMVLEQFFKDFESVKNTVWENNSKLKSDIAMFDWQPKHGEAEKVILAKPKTYMNNSGLGVKLIASYYKIDPSDIWIVHDELDLPTGSLRIRLGGASAGHRGIASIIENLGTDKFWRFRIGIDKPHAGVARKDVDDHVLAPFDHGDKGKIREVIKHASKAIAFAFEEDLSAAMNKFNTK